MSFTLPKLPYTPDALAPHIDARTMEIHYGKHHATYVSNLNKAVQDTPDASTSLEVLLRTRTQVAAIRNNGGGHWNHTFFWESLSPTFDTAPTGELLDAINTTFGDFGAFKESFTAAALGRFGSGWAWLCGRGNDLKICSTANQDNPLMPCAGTNCTAEGFSPILGLDVWEHAYYLAYQNRRPDYIAAFFRVINWQKVSLRFREL